MNPLRIVCLVACLLAAASANPNQMNKRHQGSSSLKPSDWLSSSELNAIPSLDKVTVQSLESMSVEEGAKVIEQIYHLSKINDVLDSNFVPKQNQIPTEIFKPNGQKVSVKLNELVDTAKQQPNFGKEELTIFITGLPQEDSRTVKKAIRKLEQAYQQRYNGQQQQSQQYDQENENNKDRSSSEENYAESWKAKNGQSTGTLVVIDLGATLNFEDMAKLNIQQTGNMIGNVLVDLIKKTGVPQEIVNIVAQGVAAHVAGASGRQYTRLTGNKLRRITALDPSKIFSSPAETLVSLARGDADFVDAIHTSAYGMGTAMRVGDIDFYPNGPSAGVPGADNVIEACMRATRYFAETVYPGNERNFPAVAARSLKQYQNNNGYGKRAYMGIATDFDQQGDYILEVNRKSPFGKSTPAQKQNSYHGVHQSWKNNMNNQDYE